ncbi:hypothetical protein HHE03_17340 [Helicobacter heilmannii]|uniref:Uncharacterized protein n=2 Tax=Helicobacter heilmannii TaxID=35817 RepID=A0A0K2XX12_HELHE|nr:hypothetical protein BN341_18860 [Helicobacter heilmannii ASB1.4]CRF45773.1 hypothetical protein HHE014_07470 [Helicobacter heilmannii]CRF50039.1 hypothetical protein HHE03_17340 [Helicobacter heilmannii]CRI33729.1 hypothetical protein HHE01_14150 [Helicobacter heilmannii]
MRHSPPSFVRDEDLKHLKKISTTHLPPAYARAFETYEQKIKEGSRQMHKVDLFNDHPKTDVLHAFPELTQWKNDYDGITLFWINKGIKVSSQDVRNMTKLASYQQIWENECSYLEQDKATLNRLVESGKGNIFRVDLTRKALILQQRERDGYQREIDRLQGRN